MKNIDIREHGRDYQLDQTVSVLQHCADAQAFIDAGNYSGARESLSDVWQRIGERPDLQGLDASTGAEVLLRVGVLTGWIGSSQQISKSQEVAKNLISESIDMFRLLGDNPKVAEAQIDLALCYWREGAFAEARTVIDDSLSKIVDNETALLRARALVNKSTIEVSCSNLREALECLDEAAPLLAPCDNHALLGRFHNQHALVLRKIGFSENRREYTDRSLIEYEAASSHFELAGDLRYQGAVETNLGNTYLALRRHADALAHLDHARRLFASVKSQVHVAQADEARAQVYLSQGNNAEAEVAAKSAVTIFEGGDEAALLAEALTTHGCALARLGKKADALSTIMHAVSVAERAGDLVGAGKSYLTIIEELEGHIAEAELVACYDKADEIFAGEMSIEIAQRMRKCVRRILEAARSQPPILEVGHTLHSSVLVFEREIIREALIAADGWITRAARQLGLTHQGLAFMLNNRHQELLSLRKEKRTRHRSIITKKVPKRSKRTATAM